jgi:hypothetical protein
MAILFILPGLNFCPNEYPFICHFSIIPLRIITGGKKQEFYKNKLNQMVNFKKSRSMGSSKSLAQPLLFMRAEDRERDHR